MRILLIENDAALADRLTSAFRATGDFVDCCSSHTDGEQALRLADYDMLILDRGTSGSAAVSVLKQLQVRAGYTPVLVTSGQDDCGDRVRLLDLGADDYMVKPFALAELQARVRAIARRALSQRGDNLISIGKLNFDLIRRCAHVESASLGLSPRELSVLEALLLRRGRIVSKEQIRGRLCGWSEGMSDGAIEVHIHRLRKKLDLAGVHLRNVRGFGYTLRLASAVD
jgi:two-component system OmpR family response regulator